MPEIVSLPHKSSMIKNVYFCIRLNTSSLEGFLEKLRERKRQRAVAAQKIQCSGKDSVVEAVRRSGLCCLTLDQ